MCIIRIGYFNSSLFIILYDRAKREQEDSRVMDQEQTFEEPLIEFLNLC